MCVEYNSPFVFDFVTKVSVQVLAQKIPLIAKFKEMNYPRWEAIKERAVALDHNEAIECSGDVHVSFNHLHRPSLPSSPPSFSLVFLLNILLGFFPATSIMFLLPFLVIIFCICFPYGSTKSSPFFYGLVQPK